MKGVDKLKTKVKFIKSTYGWIIFGTIFCAIIGAAIALVLIILAQILGFVGCVITCEGDCEIPIAYQCYDFFENVAVDFYLPVFIFFIIAGAVIGLVLGIAIAVEEYRELCKFKEAKEKAEQGDADAQYQCGIWYMNKEKVELAKEWLIKSVEQGHAEAIEAMCKHGILLVNNNKAKEAEEWFDKAAKQGHIASKAYLGDAQAQYEYALTLDDIYDKQKWLEKSEAQGCAPAKDELRKVKNKIIVLENEKIERIAKARASAEAYLDLLLKCPICGVPINQVYVDKLWGWRYFHVSPYDICKNKKYADDDYESAILKIWKERYGQKDYNCPGCDNEFSNPYNPH